MQVEKKCAFNNSSTMFGGRAIGIYLFHFDTLHWRKRLGLLSWMQSWSKRENCYEQKANFWETFTSLYLSCIGLADIRTSHHLTRQISLMPNLLLPLPEYLPLGSTPYICFFKLFKIWGCLESRIWFKSLYLCCVITINLDTVLVLHISCKIQLPNISPKIKTIKFVTVEQADWFHYVFCIMESLYQQFTIIL